ncbi:MULTISPECIES: hypothetical protein [unclassified Achromobacter]|uniref:hypothetical protein n=1 Tax=unclassified Achromobacter TaxID=2626865 RepID=UPI000B517B1E|nr:MULTISPECIES: hypothetical protein [unclassified Achromobacter]OWT75325.1 hypothetical protein CEY04_17110 [Achromobacter sp. HZ28]OWT75985.1 hypothetical protein CEY05_12560 [Achromobacter sp. HZ34]
MPQSIFYLYAMSTDDQLRKAMDRITRSEKMQARAERVWNSLDTSRATFINSLCRTGLSYAHAQSKFDDFVEEQRRLRIRLAHEVEAAQRDYLDLTDSAGSTQARAA